MGTDSRNGNKMAFKFEVITPSGDGILSPEDLKLFYYEVGLSSQMGQTEIYDWNKEIDEFLKKVGVVVNVCPDGTITNQYVSNTISISLSKGESKGVAFFRHLRNAFAHYHIQRFGDYFYLKDASGNKITMIGCIKIEDLKSLILLFLKQIENLH